jgi:hypothetical protein
LEKKTEIQFFYSFFFPGPGQQKRYENGARGTNKNGKKTVPIFGIGWVDSVSLAATSLHRSLILISFTPHSGRPGFAVPDSYQLHP